MRNAESRLHVTLTTAADNVTLNDSTFSVLDISLSQENDFLTLKNVTSPAAKLRGGGGTDTLIDQGGNSLPGADIDQFEA